MSQLTIPNVFVQNTVINAAPFNANFNAVATSVNSIDNTNIGAAGIFASQLLPTTGAQATFGATATGVGYKFLSNDSTATPLTVSGIAGQSVDIFDVTLTSGAKALFVNSAGQVVSVANLISSNAAAFSSPAGLVQGDFVVQRSATAGVIFLGGASTASTIDGGISHTGVTVSSALYGTGGFIATGATAPAAGQVAINQSGGAMFLDVFTAAGTAYTFRDNISTVIATIAAGTGVYTASDQRLKENIRPTSYGLAEVMKLQPSDFDMIRNKTASTGFIAQQVQAVMPLAVMCMEDDNPDGTLGINVMPLLAALVNAFQQYVNSRP